MGKRTKSLSWASASPCHGQAKVVGLTRVVKSKVVGLVPFHRIEAQLLRPERTEPGPSALEKRDVLGIIAYALLGDERDEQNVDNRRVPSRVIGALVGVLEIQQPRMPSVRR